MCRSEELMKRATNVPRDELMSMGTCFGKFNRNGKFRLAITSLEYISQFAKVGLKPHQPLVDPARPHRCEASLRVQYKVWVKPSAELSFLYGNHVTSSPQPLPALLSI
jgi:60S ribosome subunit biogenesis protein NIP7